MAAKAYDDLCASEGITFGEGYSVRDFGIAIVVFAAPLVLARSRVLIATNLIIALIVTFTASTLLTTAGNIPYECFTSMGTYEDHTSGLEDFTLIAFFATCLAYALLIIDLAIWGIRKLIAPEPKAQ